MSLRIRAGLVFLAATMSGCGGADVIAPMPPPELAIVSGDNQSATIGQPLPTPLTVSLTTAAGDPLVGDTVNWIVMSGGGTLSATSAVTDGAGRASVNWTLGNENGAQSVQASVRFRVGQGDNGFSSFGVAFSANGSPPPPPPPTPQAAILHYDGTAWTTVLQGMSNAAVSLTSIWGASSSAVFAVGSQCGAPIVLRYDGSGWTPALAQSCPGSGLSNYASVWGSSASDVFATFRSAVPMRMGGYVDHFNGQNWSTAVYVLPCGNNLDALCAGPHGVWGSSPSDVFVVADSGIIAHYDGASWQSLPSGTRQALVGVWGTGPKGDVFAVGAGGIILRYDRNTWSVQSSGTTQALNAVWGSSASDVFAVGAAGTILHYDGTGWASQNSGSTQALFSVWGVAGNTVFAGGDASTIIRYDGANWTPLTTSADIDLRGIWGTSSTNVFAVGAPR